MASLGGEPGNLYLQLRAVLNSQGRKPREHRCPQWNWEVTGDDSEVVVIEETRSMMWWKSCLLGWCKHREDAGGGVADLWVSWWSRGEMAAFGTCLLLMVGVAVILMPSLLSQVGLNTSVTPIPLSSSYWGWFYTLVSLAPSLKNVRDIYQVLPPSEVTLKLYPPTGGSGNKEKVSKYFGDDDIKLRLWHSYQLRSI